MFWFIFFVKVLVFLCEYVWISKDVWYSDVGVVWQIVEKLGEN